jgi:hypothetical protein
LKRLGDCAQAASSAIEGGIGLQNTPYGVTDKRQRRKL